MLKKITVPFTVKRIINNEFIKEMEKNMIKKRGFAADVKDDSLMAIELVEGTVTIKLPRGIWAVLESFPYINELFSEAILTYMLGRGEEEFANIMSTATLVLKKQREKEKNIVTN